MPKICKKRVHRNDKKIFPWDFKKCPGSLHLPLLKYIISNFKTLFLFFSTIRMKHKTSKPKKRNKEKKISKYQQWFHCLSVCITIPYKFIWILALQLLQYGNFSYKCCISCCDAYWMGVVLLGVSLTSMRVIKGATKVLHLLEEIR